MHRERPLERFLSRLLITSLLAAQLPLATIARADLTPNQLVKQDFNDLTDPPIPGAAAVAPLAPPTQGWGVADPVINKALEKKASDLGKKADNAAKSPIALCDPDGAENPTAGYGAPVANWPERNSPQYQQRFEAYERDRRSATVDSSSVNGVHKSFPGGQTGRPDLSASLAARQRFFDISFGHSKDGIGAVVQICEMKRQLTAQLKKFADFSAQPDSTDACAKSFTNYFKLLTDAKDATSKYAAFVGLNLKGGSFKTSNSYVKIPSLESEFLENRKINILKDSTYKPPATAAFPTKVTTQTWTSLVAENNMLWGKNATELGPNDKTVDLSGFYSSMLLQTRREKANAEELVANYKKAIDAVSDRAKKCGIAAGSVAASKTNNTITGPIPLPRPRPSDLSGASSKPQTTADPQQPGANDPTNEQLPPWQPTQQPLEQQPPLTPQPAAPAAPEGPNAVGTFLSDNWMWLAGGAVVGLGGYYVYKKYTKDQENKAYWNDDSNFMPVATTTSSSSSSSGTPAAGSKFTFISSLAGPGGIGQSMGPISVTVTDSNNVIQNVNGTVILSCATPTPCSIGGGTTATLTSGQATFTGVTFSSADQGVMLQVSGAGVQNTVAPSTFNVGGSTATNPRY